MNKKGKFIVFDATDIMCIGGFGNDKGNIELLKYSEEEISNMIIENNNSEDNIRLVNSLLGTIRKQKEVINNAIEYINDNLTISSILDGEKYYTINNYSFDYKELLDILNEVSE